MIEEDMKKIILLLAGLILYVDLFAQPKEVTLVVSGEGANKTEATNNALRSAIEQAFGTFVSANTTILNDEVVKDEIATISSGNIESYEELGYNVSDNRTNVTLKAVVSVSALVNYAKNHGSFCEFAGASFGANMKMFQLNKDNASRAFDNLLVQASAMVNNIYDANLYVGEPNVYGEVIFSIRLIQNKNCQELKKLIHQTLLSISLNEEEASPYISQGYEMFKFNIVLGGDFSKYGIFYSGEDVETRYFYNNLDSKNFNNVFNAISKYVIIDNLNNTYCLKTPQFYDSTFEVDSPKAGVIHGFYLSDFLFDNIKEKTKIPFLLANAGHSQHWRGSDKVGLVLLPKDGDSYSFYTKVSIPLDRLYQISTFKITQQLQ